MNHTFSLVWNAVTRSYQPVSEHAKRCGKGGRRQMLLAIAIASTSSIVAAAPNGGQVIDGNAQIHYQNALTVINQHTEAVTINWQGFNIDAGETVTFLQPDVNSLALNRVLSGDGTTINGQLNANGKVFVLDANGVLFGRSAQVNVGSLLASTLDISSSDLSGTHFEFSGKGSSESVINLGSITAAEGGSVVLLGGQVSNQGVIRARLGNVALAAGEHITLDFAGDGLLNVQVDKGAAQALVNNGGLIQSDGGSVLMTARASDALLQTVVNHTGVIEARTLQERDGKIMLLGGFNGGTVNVRGKLDASAPDSGDGGFIETSGAVVKVDGNASITAASKNGKAGTWLLDPTDLEISYRADGAADNISHAHIQTLQNSLNTGTNVVLETAASGSGAGNITLVNPLVWSGSGNLTLTAHNNIRFNDYLHAPSGGLSLSAGGRITTGLEGHINVGQFTLERGAFSQTGSNLPTFIARDFTLNGGSFIRAKSGTGTSSSPWQLVDIYGLQGLATTPAGHAILSKNIDASGTAGWNHGAGFAPIGNDQSRFSGSLNGNGFSIDGLTINRSAQNYVGLFGYLGNGSSVTNLGLENTAITGANQTGALAGVSAGTVNAVFSNGIINGENYTGGLIGIQIAGNTTGSYSHSTVSGGEFTGGLIGRFQGNGVISNSYATGSVTGLSDVGGLVGNLYQGSVNNSFSTGSVEGDENVGGLVGYHALPSIISTSYATGAVTSSGIFGGLVGFNAGTVTDSFWDGFTTGTGVVGVGTNTGQFSASLVNGNWNSSPTAYQAGSYAGFNFGNDWFIAEGSSRPMLRSFLNFTQNAAGQYEINNVMQLQGMAANLNGNYILKNNIDASLLAVSGNTADIWGGKGFAPIGHDLAAFTGTFDGAGFFINGLTIDRSSQNGVGLFGVINNATVKRVGLIGGNIFGGDSVGAFVGRSLSNSEISEVFSTSTVNGTTTVGGLVGLNHGSISDSYVTGAVSASNQVGGIAGFNVGGRVVNTYASGQVSGNTSGGLIGNNAGTVVGNVWDGFTTGKGSSGIGVDIGSSANNRNVDGSRSGDSSAYQQGRYNAFDFSNTWFIAEGASRPMLRAFLSADGSISNLYQLQGMAANPSGNYFLVNDIDASATAASVLAGNAGDYSDVWGGRGFASIGNFTNSSFNGAFNGRNHTISNLLIDAGDRAYIGLFGHAGSGSILRNVTLHNVDITGSASVGGLVGQSLGQINNVHVSGRIQANDNTAGGVVGYLQNGVITNSSADVIVTGWEDVGGLAGKYDGNAQLRGNRSSGSVSGVTSVGGLIGNLVQGGISNSYSDSDVTAQHVGGGLVGFNHGVIVQSYATGNVSGNEAAGGLVGSNSGIIRQTYSTGIVNGAQDHGGLVGNNTGGVLTSFWNLANQAGIGSDSGAIDIFSRGLSQAEFTHPDSFAIWNSDINADGRSNSIWRIYEGQTTPLLSQFLKNITVRAYDDIKTYDGLAYQGRHQINGTSGNGVRYGGSYAEFLDVFGEDGTPYGSGGDSLGTKDLQYNGSAQGALNAGRYALQADKLWSTQQGYNIRTPQGSVMVEAQQITITLTIDDATKIYGNVDPSFSWKVTQGVLGQGDHLTGVLSRETGENVGSYAITGRVTGDLASPNYDVTINNGVFTITPRPITISISDLEKIYGDLDPELAFAITSGSLAERDQLPENASNQLLKIVRDAGENVGSYAINGELQGALATNNYEVTLNPGTLIITPRALEITAESLSKIYGQSDPTLDWKITDGKIVDGDTLILEVSREEGNDVGRYVITLLAGGDVATSGNYDLTLVDSQLDITPAALTVTANDIRTYWNLLPAFNASVDGLVNGDTIKDVFGNSLSVSSSLNAPIPGIYSLKPSAHVLSNNYTVSFVDGLLTLLSSHPGGNYDLALTGSQLPAREALGRQNLANIFEARPLLDGSESGIALNVLDGGVRLDPSRLAELGIVFPEPVRFPVSSALVADSYLADLRRFVAQLQRYPGIQVLIEGHTSSTGSFALNDRLSRARAEAVSNALQTMGLAENRIRTEAFNYQHPVATNDTPEGRNLNQRTEISQDK